MEIIYFVISILANFIISGLLIYCSDEFRFKWKDNTKVSLRMPRVDDLAATADRYQISNYVEKVINPAHHYFLLKEEIENYKSTDGCVSFIILQASSLLLVYSCFNEAFDGFLSSCSWIVKVLIYISIFAMCALICFIIYKVYYAKFAIVSSYNTEKNLRGSFEYREKNIFAISEDAEWNNFLLSKHYQDVLRNIEDTRFRRNLTKVLYGLSAILYILFFMRLTY